MSAVSCLILCLISSLINLSRSEDCVLDHRSRDYSHEQDLLEHIRCNYDFFLGNLEHSSTELNVSMNFIMRYFSLDDTQDRFSAHLWTILGWDDSRLKWNPEDYGGLTTIVTNFILIPTLRLVNVAFGDDLDYFTIVECNVKSSGFITCMAPLLYEAFCITKLTMWPYDKQTCSLEFTPTHRGIPVKLKFRNPAVSMAVAAYGSEWTITDYKQNENVSATVQLRLSFTMEREAASLGAIIIYPSVILSVLTLSCLALDVRNIIRSLILSFSLLCHFYFLSEITYHIPKHSESSPTILLYYRGSLVLTSLSLLLTCILRYLCTKVLAPPTWMHSCNEYVYKSVARFLIWPRWYTDDSSVVEWTKFSNIINSVCKIVFVIVYLSMYAAFVPQPLPLNI